MALHAERRKPVFWRLPAPHVLLGQLCMSLEASRKPCLKSLTPYNIALTNNSLARSDGSSNRYCQKTIRCSVDCTCFGIDVYYRDIRPLEIKRQQSCKGYVQTSSSSASVFVLCFCLLGLKCFFPPIFISAGSMSFSRATIALSLRPDNCFCFSPCSVY